MQQRRRTWEGTVTTTRVTGASPIVGAWSFGNPAVGNDSGVVVFLPNGVYFEAEDGDSTPATGDPSGHDGIEHGTYAWNPTTGIITSSQAPAPYVDTNGEWGLSHTGTNFTARVSADGLTLVVSTGPSETFSLARVGAASTPSTKPDLNQHGLTGSWYEPATGGQGVEVEVFANPSAGAGSTFVSWFTYDTAIGGAERQRWYTAQGPVVTGQPNAALTIYRNTGGNFNAPPATTAQAVGTATLSFDTCSSGQLAYAFTDGTGRTGTIPLTRLTQNVTCSTTTTVSHQRGLRPVRELVRGCGHVGAGIHHRGQPEFRGAVCRLVHVPAERHRFRGRRAALVHGAGDLCAGLALDAGDDLRDHGWGVRHADASRPEDRAGGDRDDGLPELLGRDVQLQLHWRIQQRLVWSHQPEPRRTAAPGLRAVKPPITQRSLARNHAGEFPRRCATKIGAL